MSIRVSPAQFRHPFPLDALIMIADHFRDDHGELRYDDFNSFLKINSALYASLNRKLWREAAKHTDSTRRAFTHLIKNNNLTQLEFFLGLNPDFEVRLPYFRILGANSDELMDSTPLLLAADVDNIPLARLLLIKGAKVEYSDPSTGKFSPMHAARSAEMVQLLLYHKADPNLPDELQRRPLHQHAFRHESAAMPEFLQHGADLDPGTPYENLIDQAAQRCLAAVERLVEHGADVEARDLAGSAPLHLAAAAGKTDVVKFLVKRWPEGIEAKNNDLFTPLHFAATAQMPDLVTFLVEQWPEGIQERSISLNTPLHWAAAAGPSTVVRFLWEAWPEAVREKNSLGETPLHYAAMMDNIEVVRFLLFLWPQGLRESSVFMGTPLHFAASHSLSAEVVRVLLEGWPDALREKDRMGGNTPLHVAARNPVTDVVRVLVKRWPEGKEARNDNGETPLSIFENGESSRRKCDKAEEREVVALLGGVYSQANND
jgi:ankyrin repeat protein